MQSDILKKKKLFGKDASNGEDDIMQAETKVKINKEFAKKFENRKK